ncbi:MAG: pyruvate dehydrogenase (acetyl-transferring) E1 component subunit alpha, partial [Calditrichaeota bacterium]|nr:pyruvate dehydrogenase (acetyl-transferring) E1 component subunit alpha [Calditrichota bacterium]
KIKGVSLVYFGDGALSQGIFFESINLASLHNLPVIYILENNEYGMGTAVNRIVANYAEVKKRAEAFGVKTYEVDGMDVFAVEDVFDKIIASMRKKPEPVFIKVNTYRYRGHSISDPATYRSKEEVEEYKKRDPINQLKDLIISKKWANENEVKEIEKEVKDVINEAVDFAEKSDWPDISEVFDHVYKDQLPVKNYD